MLGHDTRCARGSLLSMQAQTIQAWHSPVPRSAPLTYGSDELVKMAEWKERLWQLPEEELKGPGDYMNIIPAAVVQIQALVWEREGKTRVIRQGGPTQHVGRHPPPPPASSMATAGVAPPDRPPSSDRTIAHGRRQAAAAPGSTWKCGDATWPFTQHFTAHKVVGRSAPPLGKVMLATGRARELS